MEFSEAVGARRIELHQNAIECPIESVRILFNHLHVAIRVDPGMNFYIADLKRLFTNQIVTDKQEQNQQIDEHHSDVSENGRRPMVIGIELDCLEDVLGIWTGENESAKFWLHVLNEQKNRGVQDILITSVDNLLY